MEFRYTAGIKAVNRVTAYRRRGHPMIYLEWHFDGKRRRLSSRSLLGYPVADEETGTALAIWAAANIHLLHPPAPDLGQMFANRGATSYAGPQLTGSVEARGDEIAQLPIEDLLSQVVDVRPRCGVYLLSFRGEVVYIGRTKNLMARVQAHRNSAPFRFDSVAFHELDHRTAVIAERQLIRRIRPIGNKDFNPESRAA